MRADASQVAFLVDAGISVDAPHAFLRRLEIIGALAEWLGDGEPAQAERARRARAARGSNPYALVRFEQIWQTLNAVMPDIFRTLESVELFGAPNQNHEVNGGGACGRRERAVTTNFDRRVEWALKRRGTTCKRGYSGVQCRVRHPILGYFKIHGSFWPARPAADNAVLDRDRRGLASRACLTSSWRLAERVEGRTLIVAGYSFSDHFDVVPLIENEWHPARVSGLTTNMARAEQRRWSDAIEATIMSDAGSAVFGRGPGEIGARGAKRAGNQD